MSESSTPSESEDAARRAPNGKPIAHDEVKFDESDISVSSVALILFAFAVVFVVVGLISWSFLSMNESEADRVARAPHYSMPAERLPASPRLEPLDQNEPDVFAKQIAMEHVLHSYGHTIEKGFVHIPIEQAMKLAIESMPIRRENAQPPAKSFGLVGGGESGSGRLYSEAPSWLQKK